MYFQFENYIFLLYFLQITVTYQIENIILYFILMLQLFEENIIIFLQKYKCLKYLKYFTRAFDYDFVSIILIILYLSGSIKNKDMYIILVGIILIYCLKMRYQRKRQYISNKKIMKLNDRFVDSNSFPSGHTFIAEIIKLVLLSNLNLQYSEHQFFSLITYLVALSRVYLGDHYVTDVTFSIIFARIYNIVIGSIFRLFFLMAA